MEFRPNFVAFLLQVFFLLPVFIYAQDDSIFERSLGLGYGGVGGPQFNFSASYFFGQIDKVQPPVTMVSPFLLNVDNLSPYTSFIQGFQNRSISMWPAVGKNGTFAINGTVAKDIAKAYRNFTENIHITDAQQYADMPGGIEAITDMIEYVNTTLGFKYILLDAWPRYQSNHSIIPFQNPAVNSAAIQVLLNENRNNYTVNPDPTNWYPDEGKLQQIIAYRPTANIIINYEDKPQCAALAMLSKGDQMDAFRTTIKQINNLEETNAAFQGKLHWHPPINTNYDPFTIGTWGFIAKKLRSM